MRVIMLGVSHHTAAVELREQLSLAGDALDAALDRLGQDFPNAERVVLSTCNRTELYVARPAHQPPDGDALRQVLSDVSGAPLDALTAASIHRENEQALSHLYRVASGLESMVLGEPQILGQIKRAYECATERGAVGGVLHKVFQDALAVAKRVRHETGIGDGRVSVASVAVDYARQIFDHFDDKTVVCLGAGEMAKVTLRHLMNLNPARLWVANRSPQRARGLVEQLGIAPSLGGARTLDDLDTLLVEADVMVTSTGSSEPVITHERFKPLLRRRRGRPLAILDIALPRDVEPAVGSLHDVYLYNIDDLQRVVMRTYEARGDQVAACEAKLRDAVRACMAEVQHRDVGRLVKALRHRLHEVGDAERERTLKKLAAADPAMLPALIDDAVAEHTHRLVNKILHMPLSQLDARDPDAPLAFYASALRRLFGLNDVEDVTRPPADNGQTKHHATGQREPEAQPSSVKDA